jgi:G:T-mismatch repair DNA endonuclease (very short patch repair protein)
MADVFAKAKRSEVMSRIRSRGWQRHGELTR